MNRTKVLGAVAGLLLLAGAVVVGKITGRIGTPRIRIGTALPLSGPDAALGAGMNNAMRLAIQQVNDKGGIAGRSVELVALDEGDRDISRGMAAAAQLNGDPSILAASAHYCDACAVESSGIYDEGKLPNLVPGAVEWDVTDLRWAVGYFRIIPSNREQMKQAARHAWEVLGARKYYVVHDDRHANRRWSSFFREGLEDHVRAPSDFEVSPGARDFSGMSQIMKLNAIDYVHFSGDPEQAAALVGQMRAAGNTARFFYASKFPSDQFIALAGAAVAEGALTTFATLPAEYTAGGKRFLADFAAAGFKDPGPYGLAAYGTMHTLLTAVAQSSLTRPSIIAALTRGTFDTPFGSVRFGHKGLSNFHGLALYEVRHGHWVPLSVIDEARTFQAVSPQ